MGNISSYESNLDQEHIDIDKLYETINEEGNKYVSLILDNEYTDKEKVCKQIGYQKIDELSNTFQIYSLKGVRHRLGIISLPEEGDIEMAKRQICLDIVNFYVKKVNLISNIQKGLPVCKNLENQTYADLQYKLNQNNLSTKDWLAIYQRMEDFNKEIRTKYHLFNQLIEKIKNASSLQEIDNLTNSANALIARTNTICKNLNTEIEDMSNNMPPEKPVSPRIETVVKELPVIQRTVLKPKIVRHEVVEEKPVPIAVSPKPKVLTVTQTVPAVQRVIRRRVVTPTTPVVTPVIRTPLPVQPLYESPKQSKVHIIGEKIERKNGNITVTNPKKVEIKQGQRTRTNRRPIPARAVANHIPRGPGEIELQEGQPTLYLGTTANGWARVRHADNREGYVPHSYLSSI